VARLFGCAMAMAICYDTRDVFVFVRYEESNCAMTTSCFVVECYEFQIR
jgi:hypothetical protein